MRFDVLTLFPETIEKACDFSIIKRATEQGLVSVNSVNPRDFSKDKHKKVDDTPYGGGAGMLLSCQPYLDALNSVEKSQNSKTIIMSPQGKVFNQEMAKEFATKEQLIIICGHYEGFDERIIEKSEAVEVSIGDFVMTGGEFPALCIIDSVARLIKGALGDEVDEEADERQNSHKDERQHRLKRCRNDNAADEKQRCAHAETLEHPDHLVDVVRVRGQPALEGGDGELVELTGGEVGDPAEEVVADLFRGVTGDAGGHAVRADVAEDGNDRADDHEPAAEEDGPFVPGGDDVVEDDGEEHRQEQVHDGADELDGESDHHLSDKRADVGQDVLHSSASGE